MSIRETLARWLSPSLAVRADRYWRLCQEIEESRHWLSEFKDVSCTLLRLQEMDRDHWRKLGEPSRSTMPNDIQGFRQLLRSRNKP